MVSVLHHSEDMDVILAEHQGLGTRRVLKRIRKQHSEGSLDAQYQLRRESEILKTLKHPGIPLIYDYWEDEEEICLIEEYIEGLSLQEYLLRYSSLDLGFIAEVMSQILDILVYLHDRQQPVTHQDLKTEHLLIRGKQIVLIDYGISEFLGGNAGRSQGEDLYDLGQVASEMLAHCDSYVPYAFRRMIRKACAKDMSARYISAAEWKKDITEWCRKRSGNDKEGLLISSIAVIGNQRGIGTTHVAVSITSYLGQKGQRAFYRNLSGRPGFLALEENLNTDFREKDGIIYHRWFRGMADYGPAVEPQHTPEGICVSDCGTDFTLAEDADVIIYLTGSRPWHSRMLMQEYLQKDSGILMITPSNPGMAHALAKATGHRVVSMPYDENPMHPDRTIRRVYDQIFRKYKGRKGHF